MGRMPGRRYLSGCGVGRNGEGGASYSLERSRAEIRCAPVSEYPLEIKFAPTKAADGQARPASAECGLTWL